MSDSTPGSAQGQVCVSEEPDHSMSMVPPSKHHHGGDSGNSMVDQEHGLSDRGETEHSLRDRGDRDQSVQKHNDHDQAFHKDDDLDQGIHAHGDSDGAFRNRGGREKSFRDRGDHQQSFHDHDDHEESFRNSVGRNQTARGRAQWQAGLSDRGDHLLSPGEQTSGVSKRGDRNNDLLVRHNPQSDDLLAPRDIDRTIHDRSLRDRRRKHDSPETDSDEPLITATKVKKKPGPKPTRPPVITKNDTAAKKKLIREIEGHWGKDFIKKFIPKVHRPLVKKKKGQPRTHNRKSQDNPMQWMPSVLKAVLQVAKKSDDAGKLKKIMGDAVRHRNQHTGNKKPQLVTTDFDIIEDVLEKGWTVPQSFSIRYKHLLNNRPDDLNTNTKEAHEYYKNLFRSDSEDSEDDENEELEGVLDDGDIELDNSLDNELTNDYQLQSGYYDAPPPPTLMRGYEQRNMGGYVQQPPHPRHHQQSMRPPPYGTNDPGQPLNRSDPRDARYGRYDQRYGQPPNAYGEYSGRPPTPYQQGSRSDYQDKPDRRDRPRHSMDGPRNNKAHSPQTSLDQPNRHVRRPSSTPSIPLSSIRNARIKNSPAMAPPVPKAPTPDIKPEVQDEADPTSARGVSGGRANFDISMDQVEEAPANDEEAELMAELAFQEAKMRKAQLQMKLYSARKKKTGGSPADPMSLD